MTKVLGLDLGVNSIGWTLINEENGWLECIEGMGSRIIPEKDEHRDFEKGNKITKNATRRIKRGSRKLNQRYKQRRNNLIKLFNILGITPKGLEMLFEKVIFNGDKLILPDGAYSKGDRQFKPYELYEFRAKALEEEIPLDILFRIIYHFNQRRGFKSNRKANKPEDKIEDNNEGDTKQKPEITYEKVKIMSVEPTGDRKKGKDELKIALEDGRCAISDKYLFRKFVGESLILEIKKEILKKSSEPKYTFSFPTNWQRNRKELNDSINALGGFPGKYFYNEYLKARKDNKLYEFKVRENVVNRELYENEFQKIWDMQKEIYLRKGIDINYLPKYIQAIEAIIPKNNKTERSIWIKRGLGEFIKNYIIYYQRNLKSQVKNIEDCQFEEKYNEILDEETGEYVVLRNGPKCCPKSHPAFQEFRIWQQINNLKCLDEKDQEILLTDENKEDIFNYLNNRRNSNKKDIEKFLKKSITNLCSVNIAEGKSWIGNKTKCYFAMMFNTSGCNDLELISNNKKFEELWHLFYSVDNEKGIRTGLNRINKNIPEELIRKFVEGDFEDSEKDYASLSLKAIRNLLPLMRCGDYYNEAELTEKDKIRIESFLESELDDEFDPKTLKRLKLKKKISDFAGLSYYEAASLIYGKHTAKQLEKYESPIQIQIVKQHSLRNPVVEQIVNETLMLVKDIWTEFPDLKDGKIRVELARELKSNIEERKRITEQHDKSRKINLDAIEEIREHLGKHYNPSLAEIEKIKLWNETGKRSPYTGNILNIADVLSANTEIDHIIPRSRYYNDGLVNRIICESHINSDKGNMTAYEYMNTGTPCQNEKLNYDEYEELIKSFPYQKRKMLTLKEIPDDFINRQLKDSQYIAKRVIEELGRIVGNENVKSTTGQVTDYLKEIWGVAELMRRLIKPRFEYLQDKFGIEGLVKEDDVYNRNNEPTGKKRTIIKGFSKRFDHRHHALDALIVACTRQGIIQQLNLLNQITSGTIKQLLETNNDSARKFIPPLGKTDRKAEKFYGIVEAAMNNIIVSYKNKKRLVSKGVNYYQKFNPDKNKIEKVKQEEKDQKGRAWAIKGQLHKETNYGVYKYNGQLRHISNCKMVELTENMISNIPNAKLRTEITNHINKEEYKGDIKKAFGAEGLLDFNKNRKIPVYSVRVLEDGVIGKTYGKTPLYNSERKLEVEKGSNFCLTVYENSETKERKFDAISFFDSVKLKTLGENPFISDKGMEFIKDGYKIIFTLTHNDLVYVPELESDYVNIDWTNKKDLSERIYRVVKFTGKQIYFQPHNFAKEITLHDGIAKSSKDYKGEFNKGTNGTEFYKDTGVSIKNVCIKLKVDRLGNIKPDIHL